MRLITVNKNFGDAKLEFYGCPLGCRFCAHRTREKRDMSYDQIMKYLSDYETKRVLIGGAEPALHKKELGDLIRILSKKGKEITLKTTGYDPEFLRSTIGFVSKYYIEVLTPLDDVQTAQRLINLDEDATRAYLSNVKASLEVLKGQRVRAVIRVIPTVIDQEKIQAMSGQLKGLVDEVLLVQFMSGTYDLPFEGIDRPSPPYEVLEAMGNTLQKDFKTVLIQGDGIDTTLKA